MWPSRLWWEGFNTPEYKFMRADLHCYYMLYMGRYVQMVISVLLEPKRKDFVEMLLHHTITVVVIPMSYFFNWYRVGTVVMVLLDPADVPLHLAKIFKNIAESTPGAKGRSWQ